MQEHDIACCCCKNSWRDRCLAQAVIFTAHVEYLFLMHLNRPIAVISLTVNFKTLSYCLLCAKDVRGDY